MSRDREPSDAQKFEQVLDDVVATLDRSGLKYAVIGGIAATALGGNRHTHDIDVFVRPDDAERTLAALGSAGYQIERTDPLWLYKGWKDDILVDVIFRSAGSVFFDEVMIERSRRVSFRGRTLPVLSPEDMFVIKALVLSEHSLSLDAHCMRHLNDLLSILRSSSIDWEYLMKRARLGPRRVLGLLLYAQSLDLLVPERVIRTLVHELEIC